MYCLLLELKASSQTISELSPLDQYGMLKIWEQWDKAEAFKCYASNLLGNSRSLDYACLACVETTETITKKCNILSVKICILKFQNFRILNDKHSIMTERCDWNSVSWILKRYILIEKI